MRCQVSGIRCQVRSFVVVALVAAVWLSGTTAAARQGPVVFDETVVSVNGDLILKSDICWNLALDPEVSVPEFWQREIQDLMLRTLIDQRLLLQEASKLPATAPTEDEIAAEVASIRKRFEAQGDEIRLERRAEIVGLTDDRLRQIIRQRLRILKFVDFRFRSFVVVTEPEIVDYFESEVRPADPTAMLEANRDRIQELLVEEKINAAIDSFLENARARADLVRLDEETSDVRR
jgi:hypothetical protein